MAPSVKAPGSDVEAQMKDIVQNLYNLIVQGYDHHGPETQGAMKREIQSLVQNLVQLSQDAGHVDILLPPEILDYVETSRNPDIYSRELVETTQRMNQTLKGRSEAYRSLRDNLARDIIAAMPDLKVDVERVVANTGGKLPT